jgi:uncharacterized membrane protein YkoI
MRRYALAAVGLGVVVFGIGGVAWGASSTHDPAAERAAEAAYTAAHRAQAAVSQVDAERTATSTRPGSILETHLQNEDNGLRWETKIADRSGVWEVQIDAATGRVVSSHADD